MITHESFAPALIAAIDEVYLSKAAAILRSMTATLRRLIRTTVRWTVGSKLSRRYCGAGLLLWIQPIGRASLLRPLCRASERGGLNARRSAGSFEPLLKLAVLA